MRKPRGVAQRLALTVLALAGLSITGTLPVATPFAVVVEARGSNSVDDSRAGGWRNPDARARSMPAVKGGSSIHASPAPDESAARVSGPGANGKIAFSRSVSISEVYAVNADGSNQINLTNSQGFDGSPVWSPDGSRIAFESGRDGNGEIYVMNSDGSNPRRLTNDPAGDVDPVWSPDGSRIAFVSYRDDGQGIYVINADGSNLTRLTNNPLGGYSPVWSPDGTRIAFLRFASESILIYAMNADGSNQTLLTDGQPDHTENTDPTWSPDGTRIAFARWQDFRRAIYVMNADGSNQTRLTVPYPGGTHRPVWSPDGRKIAFESEEYDYFYIYVMNADGSNLTRLTNEYSFSPAWSPDGSRIAFIQDGIYVMNADGSGQTRITNDTPGSYFDPPRWAPDGLRITFGRHIDIAGEIYVMDGDGSGLQNLTNHPAIDRYPAWSPDGSKIAFVSYRDGINIYVMNADGSGQTRLTGLPGFNTDPDWSPDGARIVFAHSHNGDNAIYVMNADGSNLTRLTDPGTLYSSPAWSPDGARIAFARFQNGNQEIYVMNSDGSGQINLTNSPGFDAEPAWSPDGTKIVFASLRNPNTNIYVMNADGSNQTRLADNSPGFDGSPVWSPDGSRIAFMRSRRNGALDIYVMNADGGSPTRLTHNLDATDLDPDWQALPAVLHSSVQFSAAGYSESEASGSVTVTVTRTGDTSAAATVSYRTSDNLSATVGCADTTTQPGVASDRCDYATTVGALTFAAGETSKTFAVPLIDDGRVEPGEAFRIALSSPGGATIGTPATATVTITDNDTAAAANPISDNRLFVRMQYLDFLSREPEPGEPWTGVLDRCPDVNNRDASSPSAACDRLLVSQSFFRSPEFQLKGFYAYLFYRVAFGRRPSYEEMIPDMRGLAGATAQEVFDRRAAYAASVTQRPEFTQLYGQMTNQQYVDALFGRYNLHQITTEDPSNFEGAAQLALNKQQLIDALNGSALTRAQVLRAVVQSNEADAAEYHGAFVSMQYYGYLRRAPEEAGYQAWLRVIKQDPGNIRVMVNGFVNSQEYRLRFGRP